MFHSALPPHLHCSALKIKPIDPKLYLAYGRIAGAGQSCRQGTAPPHGLLS